MYLGDCGAGGCCGLFRRPVVPRCGLGRRRQRVGCCRLYGCALWTLLGSHCAGGKKGVERGEGGKKDRKIPGLLAPKSSQSAVEVGGLGGVAERHFAVLALARLSIHAGEEETLADLNSM